MAYGLSQNDTKMAQTAGKETADVGGQTQRGKNKNGSGDGLKGCKSLCWGQGATVEPVDITETMPSAPYVKGGGALKRPFT